MTAPQASIEDCCNQRRDDLKEIAKLVLALRDHPCFGQEIDKSHDHSEMHSNIMLAYRHLEDARMRLGKVLQATNGGVSHYDK